MNWVSQYAAVTWNLVAEMAPYLWIGFAVAGLLRSVVKDSWVREHLGKRGLAQTIKATLIGIPLPLCSCGVIPVAAGIRRQGGSAGAVAAFTASTPQTGVDSILATAGMIGWPFSIVRVIVAGISGLVAGLLVDRFAGADEVPSAPPPPQGGCCGGHAEEASAKSCCGGHAVSEATAKSCGCHHAPIEPPVKSCCSGHEAKEAPAKACCCHESTEAPAQSCCGGHEPAAAPAKSCCCSHEASEAPAKSCCGGHADAAHAAPANRWVEGMRFAFVTLPRDLAMSLIFGLMLAGVITLALPAGSLEGYVGSGWQEYLAATLIGLPLYVCATGSIPLAVAFLHAGVSPGAVLIFLIVGPATSVATVIAMRHLIGLRGTMLYIGGLVVVSWISAFLLDLGELNVLGHAHAMELTPAWWQHAAGIGLVALLVWPLLSGLLSRRQSPEGGCCGGH